MELRIPKPFLQKHLEAFQIALTKEQKSDETLIESVYRGYVLKAAIEAGWLDKCDVGELTVIEVVDISTQIQEKIVAVSKISKK
jgi:hypothetical protein